ncbi:MAG: hypothetical protein BYD32DRAFT_419794 [Podila humilis]|nr:MAG: hypothetical protein BYD32DRAFT_419794 [Podila humilis]
MDQCTVAHALLLAVVSMTFRLAGLEESTKFSVNPSDLIFDHKTIGIHHIALCNQTICQYSSSETKSFFPLATRTRLMVCKHASSGACLLGYPLFLNTFNYRFLVANKDASREILQREPPTIQADRTKK